MTLEPDVVDILDRAVSERKVTFKQAINDAIRAGATTEGGDEEPFVQRAYDLGEPLVDLTKALSLAADLEDEEIVRKMEHGK